VTEGACELMVIRGNRIWFVRDGRKLPDWSITVDARKHPMAFDQQAGSRFYRGIYRLKGNTLTIHVREGLAESCRPTGFHESKEVPGTDGGGRPWKRRSCRRTSLASRLASASHGAVAGNRR
jgi:uncharacterized protein (TIGR03067 family)